MMQHDVHDHIHAARVRFVDEAPQLAVGIRFVGCEARVDRQEVLDAIAVIGAVLGLAVLQDRAQPDRAGSEPLQIAEALPHAFERAALETAKRQIPGRVWRAIGIVEPIDKEKITPAVPPILRRGKWARYFDCLTVDLDGAAGWCPRVGKCILYFGAENRVRHWHLHAVAISWADHREPGSVNHVGPTTTMFELVFLGTAAAAPSAERGLPALLVARGSRRFLIDCGEGTQRQLLRAGLGFRGLAHVLLTHAHLDHVLGVAGLLATFALFRVDGTIEIVGSDETLAFVRRYLADTIGPERESAYRLRAISPGPVLVREGWRLDAFAVAHRGTASLGYRFQDELRHPLISERL